MSWALCFPAASQAAELDPAAPGPRLAADPHIAALEQALTNAARRMAEAPKVAPPSQARRTGLTLSIALLLAAAFGLARVAVGATRRWNQWLAAPARELDLAANVLMEDPLMLEFFRALQEQPVAAPAPPLPGAPGSQSPIRGPTLATQASTAPDPLQERFALVRKQLAALRPRFSELSRAPGDADRLSILREILGQVELVKGSSAIPGLRPVWLMAFGLAGLLKQLASKADTLTPSTLRTTAAAIDLLEALCVPGLRADLASNPPIRLLAVDDDPISRRAVSLALKKAFSEPDLAPDGPSALVFAARQPYDAIFLDVEMPGMDGFELCSKIHETAANRTAPVVFVTMHNEFDSRAKSTLLGAYDLIAKPFLAFEITVKTLTLVLKARLEGGGAQQSLAAPTEDLDLAANVMMEDPLMREFLRAVQEQPVAAPAPPLPGAPGSQSPILGPTLATQASTAPDPLQEGIAIVRKQLAALRPRFSELSRAPGDADRLSILREILGQVELVKGSSAIPGLRPVWLMAFGLAGLLKQLASKADTLTPSTLRTTAAAIDLLEALCVPGLRADLASNPPIRLLAVDDDPISRRAVSLALKKAFSEPDLAPDGPSALVFAARQPYDAIFLDVEMPGMDGFELCSKIHETAANRTAPVVFVTMHNEFDSRAKSTLLGAYDLIAKPFLAFEITVKTLTLVLKARLEGGGAQQAGKEDAELAPTAPVQDSAGVSTASAVAPPRRSGRQPGPPPTRPGRSAKQASSPPARQFDSGKCPSR